jgi:hypothetical protein
MRWRTLRRMWRRGYIRLKRDAGPDRDESTFYRLEYRGRECPPCYTNARDQQPAIELLGPPPLAL